MRYEERLVVYGLVQELAGGQYGGIESENINSLSNMSASFAALPSGASRSCTIVSAPESRCSVHMVSCGREGEGRHLPPPETCVPSLDEQAVQRLFTCTIIHCLLSLQFCSVNFASPKFEIHFDINNVVWCMLCVIQGSKGAAQHRAGYMTIYSTYAMRDILCTKPICTHRHVHVCLCLWIRDCCEISLLFSFVLLLVVRYALARSCTCTVYPCTHLVVYPYLQHFIQRERGRDGYVCMYNTGAV